MTILSGSERVQPATLKRFSDRFARFNLQESVLPLVWTCGGNGVRGDELSWQTTHDHRLRRRRTVRRAREAFDGREQHTVGQLRSARVADGAHRGSRHLHRVPAGTVGEIWLHGDNVAIGYWNKPAETERTFGGRLLGASDGTPEGPWLKTGDSGFISDGELFIIGRIKDLLIVRGRNHSPDDIEATIQEITKGRCVAIAVPDDVGEKLVTIIEVKRRGSKEDLIERLGIGQA